MSDAVQTGDLLRFDKDNGLDKVDSSHISYIDSLKALKAIEKKRGEKSTSIYSQHNNTSTQDLFKAPSYMQLNPEITDTSATSSTSSSSKEAEKK